MKKLTAILLLMCMLLPLTANAAVWATLNQPIATRTGPGTKYTEPGGFLSRGDRVVVRSKVWDSVNEIWWVQVEFTPPYYYNYSYDKIRVYTGSWRMNVNLNNVPTEYALQTCRVVEDADAFAGPWYDGFMPWSDTIYAGTSATLLEVENGFAHIECWNSWAGSWWRGWVRLETLSCANSYRYDRYYGFADDLGNYPIGSNGGNNGNNGGTRVTPTPKPAYGTYCRVIASSAHARSGPGTQYDTVAYVYDGERYEILEKQIGNTGKTWYKIYVGKEYRTYAWISSGLCELE